MNVNLSSARQVTDRPRRPGVDDPELLRCRPFSFGLRPCFNIPMTANRDDHRLVLA